MKPHSENTWSGSATVRGVLGRRELLKGAGLAAGGAALAPLLAACGAETSGGGKGGGGGSKSLPGVSFGVLRAATGALAVVAGKKGWFKDAGVSVDFKSFAEGGGPKIIQAMAGGTPDIALVNMGTTILAVAQGAADVQIVSVPDDPASALPILSVPSIKSVPDLKGKTVTCPQGGGQYYILNTVLSKFGMSLDDVDYKPLSVGDGQAAFLTGKIDAVVSSANGTVLIQNNKPDTHVLFDPGKDFTEPPGPTDPFINPDVIIATRQAVEKKPKAITAFIEAYHNKGIGYLKDSSTHDKAVKEIQDYMTSVGAGLDDVKATAKTIDAIDWYDLDQAKKLITSQKFTDAANKQADFWLKEGVIKKAPDVSTIINTSLV